MYELFRVSKLYPRSFSCKILSMSKLGDLKGLNIHPTPFLATNPKSSGSPKDIQKSEKSASSVTNWLYFSRISHKTMFKHIKK